MGHNKSVLQRSCSVSPSYSTVNWWWLLHDENRCHLPKTNHGSVLSMLRSVSPCEVVLWKCFVKHLSGDLHPCDWGEQPKTEQPHKFVYFLYVFYSKGSKGSRQWCHSLLSTQKHHIVQPQTHTWRQLPLFSLNLGEPSDLEVKTYSRWVQLSMITCTEACFMLPRT